MNRVKGINRSRAHLRSWIKANKIKDELSNDMFSDSIQSILKLYGSHKDLLDFLIKYSPKEPLDGIYKILQKTLEKYKIKSIFRNCRKDENPSLKMDINRISTTSIETICSFLNKQNIKSFKLCNRSIAIICLDDMMKSSISISYASHLLNTKLKLRLGHDPNRIARYNANATYSFILPHIILNSSYFTLAIDNFRKHHIISDHKIYPKSALIVFNKSDVTCIEDNNVRMMTTNDMFCDDHHTYTILALHYFNVTKQEFILIKYLMFNKDTGSSRMMPYLADYIVNILVPNNLNETFNELKSLSMKKTLRAKLLFCFIDKRRCFCRMKKVNECSIPLSGTKIVSLGFQAAIEVNDSQRFEHEVTTLNRFCSTIDLFILAESRYKKTVMQICDKPTVQQLYQQIKHCMVLQKKSQTEIADTLKSLHGLLGGIEITYDIKLSMSHRKVIKHYISRNIFNNVVDAKYIDPTIDSWNNFKIVPYDTGLTINSTDVIYSITLHPVSQAPFPFNSGAIVHDPICVDIKIKKGCSTKEIIEHLTEIANNPVFNYKFKSVQETFNNYGTQFTCYVLKAFWGYTRIVSDPEDDSCSYHHYDDSDDDDIFYRKYYVLFDNENDSIPHPTYHNQPNLRNISLYLVPRWKMVDNNNNAEYHRVMIRFAWSESIDCEDIYDLHNMREYMLGLPLLVWIKRSDSLQDILERNPVVQKYKNNMQETFVVSPETLIIQLIEKDKRNEMYLFEQVSNEGNDDIFLILTLKKAKYDNIQVDQNDLKLWTPFALDRFDKYKDL